ncbi:hypothetical protein ABT160_13680 [Streptomyces sp. NPDC001941]|uniref:hypothetical protein n=1 Tax=Streptomyces sp. NPDC001941 TaxID=3154659 RepID=UPI00331E75BC
MDTAKIELALQRYQDAVAALDAARTDLETEVGAALGESRDDLDAWAEVSSLTGWSREDLTRIVQGAEAG